LLIKLYNKINMTKKIIEDVIRKKEDKEKSSREIKIKRIYTSSRNEKERNETPKNLPQPETKIFTQPRYKETEIKREEGPHKSGFFKKLVIFICIVFLISFGVFFLVKNIFSVAIKITPHKEIVNINYVFSGSINNETSTSTDNNGTDFKIETIQMTKEESGTFLASGLLSGGQKAGGVVVLYNTTSNPQYLLIDTRLETPDGKIYKTKKAVTIPANGSTEVEVYSDKPGSLYNIGLSDFNVVGFRGTAKYQKIYGRSKAPMTGGTDDETTIISKEDIDMAKKNLGDKLNSYFLEQAKKQKPQGYLLYQNAMALDIVDNFSDNPVVGQAAKNFSYKVKATGTAFLIREDDLFKKLAAKNFTDNPVNPDNIYLSNIGDLNFELLNRDNNKITFSLKGNAIFVWKIDEEKIFNDLISSNNDDYSLVFKKYPEVERAEINFYPSFWHRIPKDRKQVRFDVSI